MSVSVVMCTYNRKEQLQRGLKTLLSQKVLPDEIIIVDDGSTDGTQSIVWPEIVRYIYLDHPEPRISCIPRNVGWKAALGDIIIFTEPEALQVGNTIEKLLETMKKHPENTILASQVWSMGPIFYKEVVCKDELTPEELLQHPYAKIVAGNMINDNAPDSDHAITGEWHCNAGVLFATRKEWLEGVGGFDESFEGHGFDDFDLFNRLALYKHGIVKTPDIGVIHQWHEKGFYPYNIYEAADRNGKISEANIHKGKFKVND